MSSELTLSWCMPGEQSSFLVRKYLFLESGSGDECFSDKHIPEGSCNLIFNFKGEVRIYTDSNDAILLPPYFLTVPYPAYVGIQAIPPIDTFVVVCKTSVFSSYFGITFNGCPNPSFRPIQDVIPQMLWNALRDAESQKKRIGLFEDFVASVSQEHSYQPDSIDIAYEQIFSSHGLVQVNDLSAELNLNSRSFRRNFYRRVGTPAKSLCRIVRANHVLRIFEETGKLDFQNFVFLSKYFDQPHFVNDFRKFTGESPGSFFNRDLKMVRLLSGSQAAQSGR